VLEALEIAIHFPFARAGILVKLAEYIFGPAGASGGELSWYALSEGLSSGSWLRDLVGKTKIDEGGPYN